MSVEDVGPSWLQSLARKFEINYFQRAGHIDLYGSVYTDEVVDDLCQLKHLKSIHLSYTRITSSGVERLERALPDCEIHYSGHFILDTAAASRADFKLPVLIPAGGDSS